MSNSWLYILGLMMASSFITYLTNSLAISLLLDLGVLVAAYFIFKRDRFIDMKSSMIFITILTVVNMMVSVGTMSVDVSRQTMLALIIWSWLGARSKIFVGFILLCVCFNAYNLMPVYKMLEVASGGDFGMLVALLTSTIGGLRIITTTFVSLGALILAAYINR